MDNITSKVFSITIALLPLIAFVKVPGMDIGLGMLLLFVLLPWLFLYNLTRLQLNDIAKFSGLILFCAYSIFCSRESFSDIIGFILIMIWVIGTYKYLIDEKLVFGIMSMVSIIASVVVLIQLLFHYVFGFNLAPYIPVLIKDSTLAQYSHVINAGVDILGMYRPSAFFFEPSHFSEYAVIPLLWLLLKRKKHNSEKIALFISIGILLTRSGMGTAMVIGGWIVYYINGLDLNKRENVVNAVLVVFCAVIAFLLLLKLPFFQSAVNRVVATQDDYNAINGRLFFWDHYFSRFSFSQFVWGVGYNTVQLDKYMTGFMKLLYCSGSIGVLLFYFMLLQHRTKKDRFKSTFILFYSVLVFFAGLVSVINLVFYLTMIFSKKTCEIEEYGQYDINGIKYIPSKMSESKANVFKGI